MANEMQKMREAVNVRKFRKIAKNIRRLVDHIRKEKSLSENLAREAFDQIDDLAIEALIAPPRNCDMGTAEEQAERYNAFCRKHFTPDKLGGNCRECPLRNRRGWSCQLAWAQMPYAEEGGAK